MRIAGHTYRHAITELFPGTQLKQPVLRAIQACGVLLACSVQAETQGTTVAELPQLWFRHYVTEGDILLKWHRKDSSRLLVHAHIW